MNQQIDRTLPYYNSDTKTLFINRMINNPLILQHNKGYTNKKINIYLTVIDRFKEEYIDEYLKKKNNISENLKSEFKKQLYPIDIDKIIAYGNCNLYSNFYNKISSIFQTKRISSIKEYREGFLKFKDNNITYRNYERPFEYWFNNFLVDMCPDIQMCWNSILRKTGYTGLKGSNNNYEPYYIVIWYDCLLTYNDIKKTHKL